MTLGTARSERGKITRGHVELGAYPDGPVTSAVIIATGHRDGPTLWLQAGIHGPEVVGQIAIQRFMQGLDLTVLAGRIVCLMIANPLSFRAYNRLTPQDGANLNRIFPGDPSGSVSEQLAHRLLTLSLATGDVMLDLHSGGDLTITPFYVIYRTGLGDASARSAAFSRAVGSGLQWGSSESWLDGAAFTHFTRGGKPALIVESGGGARVRNEDIDNLHGAIVGLCQAMEMLPGTPPEVQNVRYGGNAVHIKATSGGFWQPLVEPGEDVSKGQPLGRIVDIFGDISETPISCFAHGWIGSIRRPFMPIYAGDQVIELVESVASP